MDLAAVELCGAFSVFVVAHRGDKISAEVVDVALLIEQELLIFISRRSILVRKLEAFNLNAL